MNTFSGSCSKPRRFLAGHLGIISATVPAAFMALACLAALAVFNSACGPPKTITPPAPRQRPTPVPTNALVPTDEPTPAPTLLPPVTLEEPGDGSCLACRSEAVLRWSCPYELKKEEYYRLRLNGQDSSLFYRKENHFPLYALSPGEYNWAVAVVRSIAPDEYVPLSQESGWCGFKILPPTPVVHAISPTSVFQGTSVPVVVNGDNFTRSLAVTIGVPLQATFVNSGMITATVPMTLEVDEYPVVVKDSTGEGASFVSFTVSEPPPPTSVPSKTGTIFPYPAPTPLEPPDGASFHGPVLLRWQWDERCQLGEHEHFAVRVYPKGATSFQSLTWTEEKEFSAVLYGEPAGDYCWHLVVLRGTGPDDWIQLSSRSEEWCFYAAWPSKSSSPQRRPDPTPD